MHDIHWIRKNPREFDTAMANRGADGTSQAILYLDEKRRKIQTELQGYQELRNTTSKSIGKAIADRDKLQAEALKQEVSAIKHSIQNLESQEKIIVTELNDYLSSLPNILDSDVPESILGKSGKVFEDHFILIISHLIKKSNYT